MVQGVFLLKTMTKTITIKQFAARAGVNVTTIRFYERKGLLPNPARASSGYRSYSDSDVTRIRFIRRAHDLGFTLTEILELIDLQKDPAGCAQVHDMIAQRMKEVERQLASLRAIKTALAQHERQCFGEKSPDFCPLLKALEGEDDHDVPKPYPLKARGETT